MLCISRLLLLICLFITPAFAFSEEFFYEPFDYPAGPILDAPDDKWQIWDKGPGSLINVIDTPSDNGCSLACNSLPAPIGNRLELNATNSGQVAAILPWSTPHYSSLYCSLLLKCIMLPSENATPVVILTENQTTIPFGRLAIRRSGSAVKVGVQMHNRDAVLTNHNFATSETIHVVIKYTPNPESELDTMEIFVNPNTSEPEPLPDAQTESISGLDVPVSGLNRIVFREQTNMLYNSGKLEIDEVRAASSWEGLFPAANSVADWKNLEE